MDPAIVAAGLSAGANLLGGVLGKDPPDQRIASRKANFGAIQGKVQAANQFGISKLYALGAPTASPTFMGSGGPSLGETISSMGQDLSRAVAAGQTSAERQLQGLALEKAALENDFLRSQIASIKVRTAREIGPALPPSTLPNKTDGRLIPEKMVPPQRTTGWNMMGIPMLSNPWFSDAQTHEDRGGEVAGSVLGLANYPADMVYTYLQHLRGNWGAGPDARASAWRKSRRRY